MKPRIGHIVFHPILNDITKAVAIELQDKIDCIEIANPNPLNEKEILQTALDLQTRCDVIISREDTINLLAPNLTVPVIGRSLRFSDIIEALYLASKKSKKVGLVLHCRQDIDLSYWPQVFGIEIYKSMYNSRRDALPAVLEVIKMGAEIITGGVLVGKHVTSCGVKHQMILQTRDTVVELIYKAIDIFNAIQKEKEYTTRFQTLLDFVHEGVIFLDHTFIVGYVNNRACQILKVAKNDLLNQDLTRGLKNILLPEGKDVLINTLSNIKEGPQLGVLLKLKDTSLVVNIVSPQVGNGMTTIMTFTEAAFLQKMEYKVRQQLTDKGLVTQFTLDDIISNSEPILNSKKLAKAFATTDSNILIYGETGTGKELFAQSIHNLSPRNKGPFVAINCSALPKELMESELFGYEEGAFTGARKSGKIGLFELAHAGTIFLDELSTMQLDLQAKILRVIQEKKITRLGGDKVIPVNVRIIAATNLNLREAVQNGQFRQDLYFRLNVLLLKIPPLREREGDIPLLFKHFVAKFSARLNPLIEYPSEQELEILLKYDWPGNVRELENFAERFVATSIYDSNTAGILESLLPNIMPLHQISVDTFNNMPNNGEAPLLTQYINKNELELFYRIGAKNNWNKKLMAKDLGISETTLWRKLKKAGISAFKRSPL